MSKIDVNDPKIKLERGDSIGPIRFMAMADGYVMVRRPGAIPWAERLNKWVSRPLEADAAPARDAYSKAFGSALKEQEEGN
jgi:hypothetical protein